MFLCFSACHATIFSCSRCWKKLFTPKIFGWRIHDKFHHNYWYWLQDPDNRYGGTETEIAGASHYPVAKPQAVPSFESNLTMDRYGTLLGRSDLERLLLRITVALWEFCWFTMSRTNSHSTIYETGCVKFNNTLQTMSTRQDITWYQFFWYILIKTRLQILIGNKCDMLDKKVECVLSIK